MTTIFVGSRYFETLGLAAVRGRLFNPTDASIGREGAIVNQRFAATFLSGEDPIGQRIQLTGAAPAPPLPWLTIVGVTPTLPSLGPAHPRDLSEPTVDVPFGIDPSPRVASLVVRTPSGLSAGATVLRDEVRALDPDLPLYGIETMDEALARSRNPLVASWFAILAVIALVVAGVGVYAVTSHGVAQRTQEIGVRMALGARTKEVVWLFLRRTVAQLLFGITIGLGGSLAVGRLLAAFLGQTSPRDPLTIATVIGLLLIVVAAASALAAHRASRVDPAVALRAE